MKNIFPVILFLIFASEALAQVPYRISDNVKAEMRLDSITVDDITFRYKAVYPEGYDDSKNYPAFIGFTGGKSYEKIVDLSYVSLYRSKYLDGYIKILPMGHNDSYLKDLSTGKIEKYIAAIENKESLTENGWLIAGTAYGSIAAFRFAKTLPEKFDGIISIAGMINFTDIPEEWKTYKVLVAYGQHENIDWKSESKRIEKLLQGKVAWVDELIIPGQGHIISPNFNINTLYEYYFLASGINKEKNP